MEILASKLFQQPMKSGQIIENDDYQVAYYTQKANYHELNEDAGLCLILDAQQVCLAVADGVGGSDNSQQASRLLLSKIEQTLSEQLCIDSLQNTIAKVNQKLLNKEALSQTTLTFCLIDHGQLQCLQVGDSGALVIGQRGKVKYHTPLHSPVGHAWQMGELSERAAVKHPERHIVDNVVGDEEMKIHISRKRRLKPKDNLILASDGWLDNLLLAQWAACIKGTDFAGLFERMVQAAQVRLNPVTGKALHKEDDMTLILCRQK